MTSASPSPFCAISNSAQRLLALMPEKSTLIIKGNDVVTLLEQMGLKGEELNQNLQRITKQATADLAEKGFAVADMKPDHVIIGEKETAELGAAANGKSDAEVLKEKTGK